MVKPLAGCLGYGISLLVAASFVSSHTLASAGSAKQVRSLNACCVEVDQDLQDKPGHPWQMERLIHLLEGEWDTEDTNELNGPTGMRTTVHSLETFRPGPARLSLIEEFRSKDLGTPLMGVGVFWWEQASHGIHVLWCDNDTPESSCRLLAGAGVWQGDEFVLTDVHHKMNRREIWSDLATDSFTQTIFQGESKDTMRKILTIKAHRIGRPIP